MEKKKDSKAAGDCEEPKELTKEEKDLLKKLEKGEIEMYSAKKGPLNKDPKYQVYSDMGYEVDAKQGLIYRDAELISNQRKVVFHLLKSMGSNVMNGKSVMNVSLPVNVFDNVTLLQRSAIDYAFAPIYAEKMVAATDPIEKMKLLIGMHMATLHRNISQKKPFNPIWGETYQGSLGSLKMYCEQTSHHPPICHIYGDGPHCTLFAKNEFSLRMYPNSAVFACVGFKKFIMKDKDRTTYKINLPSAEVKGTMFGTRTITYKGVTTIKDKTNGIYAQLRMNAGEKSFAEGLFKKQGVRNDFFKGLITKNKALLKDMTRKAFYSKEMISYIEGSWLDYVMIDGDKYWEVGMYNPLPLVPDPNPLPSDSTFRLDLRAFIAGNQAESQKQKEILEEIQRNDRKLRDKFAKKKQNLMLRFKS